MLFTLSGLVDLAARCGLDLRSASYTQGGPQWASSIMAWLHLRGWIEMSPERIINVPPLFAPIAALTAGFDLLRLPFSKTAQMVLVFRREPAAR